MSDFFQQFYKNDIIWQLDKACMWIHNESHDTQIDTTADIQAVWKLTVWAFDSTDFISVFSDSV